MFFLCFLTLSLPPLALCLLWLCTKRAKKEGKNTHPPAYNIWNYIRAYETKSPKSLKRIRHRKVKSTMTLFPMLSHLLLFSLSLWISFIFCLSLAFASGAFTVGVLIWFLLFQCSLLVVVHRKSPCTRAIVVTCACLMTMLCTSMLISFSCLSFASLRLIIRRVFFLFGVSFPSQVMRSRQNDV